jgi:hypothetical protein
MRIVREIYPNSMPMLIQGVVDEERGCVTPESVKLYPVINEQVLPASPAVDTVASLQIAQRLTNLIHQN